MKKYIYILTSIIIGGIGNQSLAQGNNPNQQNEDLVQRLNTITTAVPFMLISPDSRAGGMGDIGAATSPTANALHWNTSKLIFAEKPIGVSISYSPWLQKLVNDIHLSYLSGYATIGKKKRHVVGGSLRYFSLGKIQATDPTGQFIREIRPNEFALTAGYGFKLSKQWAIGVNGSFIYSDLFGGLPVAGGETKKGISGAADISLSYFNDEIKLGKKKGVVSFGTTFSNIGSKMAYSSTGDRDFLPMNWRVGTAFKIIFDKNNSLTASIDFNKLLVPTPPIYQGDSIVAGRDPDVGIAKGMIQSFYDAPGTPIYDDQGNFIGVEKGSRFKEEMREINFGVGLEYWYGTWFSFRVGYFHEPTTKGDRKYLTLGAGMRYKVFGLDFSYLAGFKPNHPLANTIRFTLHFMFDKGGKKEAAPKEVQ